MKNYFDIAAEQAQTLLKALDARLEGDVTPSRDFARCDLSANHALKSAKAMGESPAASAQKIADSLFLDGSAFKSVAAENGFLNFRLADSFYKACLAEIAAEPETELAPRDDAANWCRSAGIELNEDLFSRSDGANPVYFAQYSYKRANTLLERCGRNDFCDADKRLCRAVLNARASTAYISYLAQSVRDYYTLLPSSEQSALVLGAACKTLKTALNLIGVSAPRKM